MRCLWGSAILVLVCADLGSWRLDGKWCGVLNFLHARVTWECSEIPKHWPHPEGSKQLKDQNRVGHGIRSFHTLEGSQWEDEFKKPVTSLQLMLGSELFLVTWVDCHSALLWLQNLIASLYLWYTVRAQECPWLCSCAGGKAFPLCFHGQVVGHQLPWAGPGKCAKATGRPRESVSFRAIPAVTGAVSPAGWGGEMERRCLQGPFPSSRKHQAHPASLLTCPFTDLLSLSIIAVLVTPLQHPTSS